MQFSPSLNLAASISNISTALVVNGTALTSAHNVDATGEATNSSILQEM